MHGKLLYGEFGDIFLQTGKIDYRNIGPQFFGHSRKKPRSPVVFYSHPRHSLSFPRKRESCNGGVVTRSRYVGPPLARG